MKLFKIAFREIKGSLGRYIAIFTIVLIGVGFFSGLSICKEAMISTGDEYLKQQSFYDYRLLSTLGFTSEDVDSFAALDGVTAANGAYFADAIVVFPDNAESVFRVHSITEHINTAKLLHGEMPKSPNECIVDSQFYRPEDVGKKVRISKNNSDDTLDALAYSVYIIVGIVTLPQYLNIERGTTPVGSGRISAYICIPPDGFKSEYYHEIYLTVNDGERIFSREYKDKISAMKDEIEALAEERVNARYDQILADIANAAAIYPEGLLPDGVVTVPPAPTTFVLTREANMSYVFFENDSGIVGGIARVFPVFFFLVAALVCVTTMSRMIEEQRTQIGVLKSLGYGNLSIISKYFLYSGSAGVLGCLLGYFGGTIVFPAVIWNAFNILYPFADNMTYEFNSWLLLAAMAVTCICTIGVTLFCCFATLRSPSADLIRPKSPKPGKRTILERASLIWNRLSFLYKVSLRNLFRYRQRFFMMIIGIGGCTALLLAGFGIRDSISNVVADQYGNIVLYDAEISFSAAPNENEELTISGLDGVKDVLYITTSSADISVGDKVKNISVIAPARDSLEGFMTLKSDKKMLSFPQKGEVIINSGLAEDMGIKIGDKIVFTSTGLKISELTVSGIFENYIGNFAYVSINTASEFFESTDSNGAYAIFEDGADPHEMATELLLNGKVSNVNVLEDMKNRISDTMKSLNYIVIVVILSAGALAFVVLYNLTNINITERIREIATIKVLGFYDKETSSYVFRENNILTFIGAGIGLIAGKFLHTYIVSQVNIDFIKFSTFVDWKSYIYSAILTLVFALIMQIIMNRKLRRINMAESLKTVE